MDVEYMNGRWTGSGTGAGYVMEAERRRTRINTDDPSALGVGHSRKGSSIFPALRKLAAPVDIRTFTKHGNGHARGHGHGETDTEMGTETPRRNRCCSLPSGDVRCLLSNRVGRKKYA